MLRNWDNFYTSYRDTSTGRVTDRFGTPYDLSIIRADDGVYDREYTGVHTQLQYRPLNRLNIGATYAWSRLVGNVTGEDTGSGPLVGVAGEYPEYREESWNYPMGYLTGDQRHRARLWAIYDLPTPIGGFAFTLLQHFDSGTRTSVDGVIDSRPYVTNPGYIAGNLPTTVSYFFGGRGNLKTEDITRTDVSLNYNVRLFKTLELFIQPEVPEPFQRARGHVLRRGGADRRGRRRRVRAVQPLHRHADRVPARGVGLGVPSARSELPAGPELREAGQRGGLPDAAHVPRLRGDPLLTT